MLRLPEARYVLPNLFTLAASFCGFAMISMAFAAEEARQFYLAASLVPVACLLDGFDGRVARLVHGESKFGVQLDSLSDFLTFGVAPACLVYTWALEPLGVWGLLTAFLFAAAAMARLARFNVAADDDGGSSRYFEGLPAPMAGMAIASLVALEAGVLHRTATAESARPAIAAFVVIMALLMVSQVPFRTFKDLRLTPLNRLLVALVLGSVTAVALTVDPMLALSGGLFGYIGTGLTGAVISKRRAVRLARHGAPEDEDELELYVDDDDDAGFA